MVCCLTARATCVPVYRMRAVNVIEVGSGVIILNYSKRFVATWMILGAALAVTAQDSFANPDFTKKTGKKCTYCHCAFSL